ncbi:hypothetical protein PIB30_056321 [Stylosanthes scabra]|uniref:Secreted protein n=1 Tax=Stylosanthes scabra TaxID=79078 RepID=A0ABU6SJ95_9FABA|nr:hypothetical protein [Stylosanthes scabra]
MTSSASWATSLIWRRTSFSISFLIFPSEVLRSTFIMLSSLSRDLTLPSTPHSRLPSRASIWDKFSRTKETTLSAITFTRVLSVCMENSRFDLCLETELIE